MTLKIVNQFTDILNTSIDKVFIILSDNIAGNLRYNLILALIRYNLINVAFKKI